MYIRLEIASNNRQIKLFIHLGGYEQKIADDSLLPKKLGYLIYSHTYRVGRGCIKDELSAKPGGV